MAISVTHGDLLTAEAPVLVCTVNLRGAMGAGVAKAFRDRYPDLYYHYKQAIRYKQLTDKDLAIYPIPYEAKTVILVPTKDHWIDPSPWEMIENGVQRLASLAHERCYSHVALPPMGCGHGGWDWAQVKPLYEQHFADHPTHFTVWI